MGVVGIKFDGPIQKTQRLHVFLALTSVMKDFAREHAFVGRHVFRRPVPRPVSGVRLDPAGKCCDNRDRDLVLDGEDVL